METKDSYRSVLWVRHCFGCHNKVKWKLTDISSYSKLIPSFGKYETESRKQAYKLPSYCTEELGEIQALIFGYRLKNILKKFNNELPEDFPIKYTSLDLYSSVLPRAMETAKLISKETIQSGLNNSMDKIKRINFIQEKVEQQEDYVNSTSLTESNNSIDLLNKEFNKDYCEISREIPIKSETTDKNYIFKTSTNEEIETNYNKFKSTVLDDLSDEKLNLIVSHSSFLQKSLKFSKDKKMQNLDAYLIIYKKNSLNEWEEVEDLRKLYLFAENEIIETTNGVLIPPVREKRKIALKNSNNAIESFGLKLLKDVSDTSDKYKTNIKYYKDQALLNKKTSIGSCSNKPIIIDNSLFLEDSPDTVTRSIKDLQRGGLKKYKNRI